MRIKLVGLALAVTWGLSSVSWAMEKQTKKESSVGASETKSESIWSELSVSDSVLSILMPQNEASKQGKSKTFSWKKSERIAEALSDEKKCIRFFGQEENGKFLVWADVYNENFKEIECFKLPVLSDGGSVEDKQKLMDLLNIKPKDRLIREVLLDENLAIYVGWKGWKE